MKLRFEDDNYFVRVIYLRRSCYKRGVVFSYVTSRSEENDKK